MSTYNTSGISDCIEKCIRRHNKVLVFGVGGNAANAIHFAAELQGKYEKFETPMACIDLCSNPSILTAITNDFGWDYCYKRQISALAQPGDIVVALSISTKGQYLVNAINEALDRACQVILICGKYTPIPDFRNQRVLDPSDRFILFELDSLDTPKVQEVQLSLIHQICGVVKSRF
jgi:D-sedoheptulose 7-phosphate isomerase